MGKLKAAVSESRDPAGGELRASIPGGWRSTDEWMRVEGWSRTKTHYKLKELVEAGLWEQQVFEFGVDSFGRSKKAVFYREKPEED